MIKNRILDRNPGILRLIASVTLILLFTICACISTESKPDPVVVPPPSPPVTPQPQPPTATTQPSSGPTLHLIVFADTNDYKIGDSVTIDSRNVQNLFGEIVKRSNGKLFLNKIVFEGYSVTQKNMLESIASLRVRSDDIIVFLYAGHGHRYQSTASKWPLMDTMNHPTDFLTVITNIRNKYTRQFIALADCCNEVVDLPYRMRPALPRNDFLYSNITRMFLNSTVKISASGCKPGQLSYGDDVNGGYFTSAFISSLRDALLYPGGTWEMVLQNTRSKVVQKTGNEQEPQYEKSGN